MKRIAGIWYVKAQGVWYPAGVSVHSAIKYARRLLDILA